MGEVSAAIGIVGRGLGPGGGLAWAPRARRCLFGPPDPQATRALLQEQAKLIEEESKERWNFDFVSEKPLSGGRYAWTPVDCGQENGLDEKVVEEKEQRQTLITDFMRKRKLSTSSSQMMTTSPSKSRRRFST